MMRFILFGATNIAVLMVLSVVLRLLGIDPQSSMGFLAFAAITGMAGSFISLLMSKSGAKRSVRAQVITQPANEMERWLVDTVARQAEQAGIGMPEVAIFPSSTPNAFATGAKRNDALVAVSTGLLEHMTRDEVEAVLGHEVSHVANGDMITMTLMQGVVNTFVLVLSHVLGSMMRNRDSGGGGMGYFMGRMVGQMVFGFLASLIVMWFSRHREFHADEGGAALSDRSKMIAALERLQSLSGGAKKTMPDSLAAFGIVQFSAELMTTHPPLHKRIAALKQNQN
jgi:heat shock protein HtpX